MVQHVLPLVVNVHVGIAGEIVAVGVGVFGLVVHVRLDQFLAVEVHFLVHQLDAIAGHAHAALHEGLADIHRIAEDDNIAAFDRLVRQ